MIYTKSDKLEDHLRDISLVFDELARYAMVTCQWIPGKSDQNCKSYIKMKLYLVISTKVPVLVHFYLRMGHEEVTSQTHLSIAIASP